MPNSGSRRLTSPMAAKPGRLTSLLMEWPIGFQGLTSGKCSSCSSVTFQKEIYCSYSWNNFKTQTQFQHQHQQRRLKLQGNIFRSMDVYNFAAPYVRYLTLEDMDRIIENIHFYLGGDTGMQGFFSMNLHLAWTLHLFHVPFPHRQGRFCWERERDQWIEHLNKWIWLFNTSETPSHFGIWPQRALYLPLIKGVLKKISEKQFCLWISTLNSSLQDRIYWPLTLFQFFVRLAFQTMVFWDLLSFGGGSTT